MEKRRNLLDLENINVDSLTSNEVYNTLFSKLGINNYADLEKYKGLCYKRLIFNRRG